MRGNFQILTVQGGEQGDQCLYLSLSLGHAVSSLIT